MRILNWVQSRLYGRKEKKDFDRSSCAVLYPPEPELGKGDLVDWRQGLLAIGTLGTKSLKEEDEVHHSPLLTSQPSHEVSDFTIEEVMKLQKELCNLLKNNPKSIHNAGSRAGKKKSFNILPSRVLNCPASHKSETELDEMDGVDLGDLSPDSIMILRKARDLLAQNRNGIRRKSTTFILKNFFICRSGFASPASLSLRDPIVVSSMEKLLRIMLHKKIFPQSSAPMEEKKFLENKQNENVAGNDKDEEKEDRDCKWDKTDSDFIVLEI